MTADFCHWVWIDAGFTPFVVNDDGSLVRTNWASCAVFFNDSFESTDAALEFWS